MGTRKDIGSRQDEPIKTGGWGFMIQNIPYLSIYLNVSNLNKSRRPSPLILLGSKKPY
jgi:hypothetical protein